MSAATRDRFLAAATRLFRRQGYSGTGLKQIVTEGGAPLGSLYHFFPGGKEDLALQSVSTTADRYDELLDRVFSSTSDSGEAAVKWFDWAARALVDSDYADGCPIGTLACEVASTNEPLRSATQHVFDSWCARVASQLIGEGVTAPAARRLAVFAVSSLEGAILLGRVQRSTRPLRDTGRTVADTLHAATRADGAPR